jgi:hypothetical protein
MSRFFPDRTTDYVSQGQPRATRPLRPLSFGGVLDEAFDVYRREFGALFLAALVPLVPAAAAGLLALLRPGFARSLESFGPGPLLLGLALVICAMLGWAALACLVSDAYLGGRVSVSGAYRRALGASLRLAGAGIVALLLVGAALAVVGLIVTRLSPVPVAALVAADPRLQAVTGLLIAAAAVEAAATFFAVVPAVVLEGKGPLAAFSHSAALADGGRLRIVGVWLAAQLIRALAAFGVGAAAGFAGWLLDPRLSVVASVVAGVVWGLSYPFSITMMVLQYYDLRARADAPRVRETAAGLAFG